MREGEVFGVVFAFDAQEEVDYYYGDGTDWEAGGVLGEGLKGSRGGGLT